MLTHARVERLLTDLSGRARAETAAIVADEFVGGCLSKSEQQIAADILAVFAEDVEQIVRETLAERIKCCPFLPPKIALTLARDLDPVAVPVLRHSPLLNDDDLVAVVRMGSTPKQRAIARREHVAEVVTDALIDTRKRQIVEEVLGNQGAVLSAATFSVLVDRYRDDPSVQMAMASRSTVPAGVIERLLRCASAEVAARLMTHPKMRRDGASAASPRRDRAFIELISGFSPAEIERLVADMAAKTMLEPILLLRGLCAGQLLFFETGMAAAAAIPVSDARLLIHDQANGGLAVLATRAGIHRCLVPAFRTAIDVLLDGGDSADQWLLMSRIMESYPELAARDIEELLSQLMELASTPSRSTAVSASVGSR